MAETKTQTRTVPTAQVLPESQVPAVAARPAPPASSLHEMADKLPGAYEPMPALVLTPEEQKALALPVPDDDYDIRPEGQVYLPYGGVLKHLNAALGIGNWCLKPASPIVMRGEAMLHIFHLYVKGVFVAEATGGATYRPGGNRAIDYHDAVEACRSGAVTRAGKHWGIGMEAHDKRWAAQWVMRHACQVWCLERTSQGERRVMRWRRTDSPTLPGEETGERAPREGVGAARRPQQGPQQAPGVSGPATSGTEISEGKLKRLWAIARDLGIEKDQLYSWLGKRFGIADPRLIHWKKYDEVVEAMQAEFGERQEGDVDVVTGEVIDEDGGVDYSAFTREEIEE